MRCKTISAGLPLRTNLCLLAGAIVCAAVSSLRSEEAVRITSVAVGWVLVLVAVGPSLFGFVRGRVRKGKGRYIDPDTIVPGWRQFCQAMGVKKAIKVKVFPGLRNAYPDLTNTKIKIGQPVLDSLDSASIKAVVAHELAHIGGGFEVHYTFKQKCLLFGVRFGALLGAVVLLGRLSSGFGLPSAPLFWFSVLLAPSSLMGISARFMLWSGEYQADLMAMQYVNREAVVSFLKALAALRKLDLTQDFYTHPGINRRIANLGWPQETRFRKWYFEL
jgi:Zn-dependent protease with chaperone function